MRYFLTVSFLLCLLISTTHAYQWRSLIANTGALIAIQPIVINTDDEEEEDIGAKPKTTNSYYQYGQRR